MGLKVTITIDGAKSIDNGIWKARLKPAEVATLGDCHSQSGPFSVLMLEANVDYNHRLQTLTFDPEATRLLNVGNTDQILVLSAVATPAGSGERAATAPAATPAPKAAASPPPKAAAAKAESARTMPEIELSQTLATGDKLFLSELPADIRELGEKLLSEVRRHFPGELCYEPRAAKFDETPEIFWTIKIQPQDKSLRITVRGTPESFESVEGIDPKLDKFGYSAFVLTRTAQIPAAFNLIRQARKNMR
jgi:hypothetical protein